MTTQTASTASSTPPRNSSFDVTTGKAVTLGMDLYSPGDDPELNLQWHLKYLGDIAKVWQDYTGKGVSVGIYDTGVQSTHWDLDANVDKSKELVWEGTVQSGEPSQHGHGTCVAGLIAAERNGQGGVGIAYGATLTGLDYYTPGSHAYDYFSWAISEGSRFDLINGSWGWDYLPANSETSRGTSNSWWGDYTTALNDIATGGRNGLGTVLVKASGNVAQDDQADGLNGDRHVIMVSAYNPADGTATSYSNSGAYLLVAAPSNNLVTTDLMGTRRMSVPDYTNGFGGTSGATPIASGVVTLLMDANPNLGWRDVRNIMAASAKMPIAFETGPVQYMNNDGWTTDLNERYFQLSGQDANWNGGAMHYSNDYGYGAVDAYSAARMAEVWSLFGAAKVSSNEVHVQVGADVGLTASSGTANVDPTRMQKFGDFINAPVRFQFEVKDAVDLEHVDLTLNFRDKVTFLKDGQPVSDAEFYNSLSDAQFKLIAPDGSYAFSTHDRGISKVDSPDQQFMLGFSGFHGVESKGIWTLEFSTWSASDWRDGPVIRATDLTIDSLAMDLYGSTPTNDDVYTYTNEFFKMAAIDGEAGRMTLIDTNGGDDWINAAAVSKDIALSLVGGQTTTFGGQKAFTIDRASVIENAVTGDGNDTLIGNRYANILVGMRGNDVLNGGMGDDILSGGTGSNRFVFDARSGHDTIVDWARSDILQTVKALKGVGSDGTLTVGANATLLLDGTANGNTVLLTDHSGAKLQSLGQKDGYYWYAYVADAAADAGKVVQEFASSPAATAAGAVDQMVASSANSGAVNENAAAFGAHDAGVSTHAIDSGFFLYDAMAGSMNGGVQLFA